jgi:hypothetical protein
LRLGKEKKSCTSWFGHRETLTGNEGSLYMVMIRGVTGRRLNISHVGYAYRPKTGVATQENNSSFVVRRPLRNIDDEPVIGGNRNKPQYYAEEGYDQNAEK